MDDHFEQRLAQRLEVLEELRDILGSEGITCPGVVVVGEQSSGKSSVLERLTDIAFPRGTDTCTRVPIIVQLQKDPSKTTPIAKISRDRSFKTGVWRCETKQDITNSIQNLMTEIVESTASPVHDTPIHIKYIRNKGPVMTLIDLPGITRFDAHGRDIHGPSSAMVRNYIRDENMIVLVVLQATSDFGNSDALDIARSCDVNGDRTIGVVTKCDLLRERSDIIDTLRMTKESKVKLRLGFIAVRNRGLDEESIDIEHEEDHLFKTHPELRKLRDSERGYKALRDKIVSLQESSVERAIPVIRQDIHSRIDQLKKSINDMGKSLESDLDRNRMVSEELLGIDGELQKLIRGESSRDSRMYISARATDLYKKFKSDVKNTFPNCFGSEYTEELKEHLQKIGGYSLPNFANDPMFRRELGRIFFDGNVAPKAERLIDEVGELMSDTLLTLIGERESMKRLPTLANVFKENVQRFMVEAQEKAKNLTEEVIKAESVQVFTLNDNYMKQVVEERAKIQKKKEKEEQEKELRERGGYFGNTGHFGQANGTKPLDARHNAVKKPSLNSRDDTLIELQISLHCYGTVLMTRLFDVIPMLIQSCLVHSIKENFQYEMQVGLREEWSTLFQEDGRVTADRKALNDRLRRMEQARRKFNRLSRRTQENTDLL